MGNIPATCGGIPGGRWRTRVGNRDAGDEEDRGKGRKEMIGISALNKKSCCQYYSSFYKSLYNRLCAVTIIP
jgi:hypothetical protein